MKFKNVSIVSTSDGLISIFCDHECRGTHLYHEHFFLNKEHKLVAHFKSTGCLHVEQLSEDVVTVSSRLGHADKNITLNTYSHLIKSREAQVANKMDEFYAKLNVG